MLKPLVSPLPVMSKITEKTIHYQLEYCLKNGLLYKYQSGITSVPLIDYFSVSYVNHVIIGDCNLDPTNALLKNFMNSDALYNLIQVDTCFKDKGTCIDFILTNRKCSFKNTNTFETQLVTITT